MKDNVISLFPQTLTIIKDKPELCSNIVEKSKDGTSSPDEVFKENTEFNIAFKECVSQHLKSNNLIPKGKLRIQYSPLWEEFKLETDTMIVGILFLKLGEDNINVTFTNPNLNSFLQHNPQTPNSNHNKTLSFTEGDIIFFNNETEFKVENPEENMILVLEILPKEISTI